MKLQYEEIMNTANTMGRCKGILVVGNLLGFPAVQRKTRYLGIVRDTSITK
jgi:hypothetical protein